MTRARSLTLVAAVLAPVVVGALLCLVRELITNNNAALVLVLVVVAVAATGDRVAGLVAAVVSAAVVRLLPHPALPDLRHQRAGRHRGRRAARADRPRGHRDRALGPPPAGAGEHARGLPGRRGRGGAARRLGRHVRRPRSSTWSAARSATSSTSTPARSTPARPHVDRPRLEADGGITWRGRAVDVDREGLPTLDLIELPVTLGGCRPRPLPAHVDERGAAARPGTAPGRRHARRAGRCGPGERCTPRRPARSRSPVIPRSGARAGAARAW